MKQQVVLKTNLVVYTYVVGSTKKLPTLTGTRLYSSTGQHGHSCIRSAAPSGTIFAYCLFVNIHLLEKGTLLQISRNRLPPVKSNNCYNVR